MTDQRDDIDELLAIGDSYVDDGGFTERVSARLPRRAGRRAMVRVGVLSVATLLAAAVGFVALPIDAIVAGFSEFSAGGWTTSAFIAGTVSLAVVIWAAATSAFSES